MFNLISDNQAGMSAGICTLGCRVNQYESNAIARELERNGIAAADFSPGHDIYIINTCAVTSESVRKSRQMIRRARSFSPDAFIAVCGCASQLDGERLLQYADYVCGTRNKASLLKAILDFLHNGRSSPVCEVIPPTGDMETLSLDKCERARAFVKIEDGCDGKCAYCVIPSLRGGVVSKPPETVEDEVRKLIANGSPEIILTGIETSAYEYGLGELIRRLDRIEGLKRLRLGSLEPSSLKESFIEQISGLRTVMPHFHISLQSGSSRVLALMRRKYNAETAFNNIMRLREAIPGCSFSADIITGFPGETDEDFSHTCEFVKAVPFLHTHIFTYSKRPGTVAASMAEQIPEEIKIQRSAALSEIERGIRDRLCAQYIESGKTARILVETDKNNVLTGHTPDFFEVRLQYTKTHKDMRGKIIDTKPISYSDGIINTITDEEL